MARSTARKFVAAGVLAASAVLASGVSGVPGGGSAVAAEVEGPKVTWLVSLWGNRRAFTESLEKMKELIEEKTGGNFKMDLRYGEVLAGVRENVQGLKAGAFEMAMTCISYDPAKTPGMTGLELPFIKANADFMERVALEERYIHHPAILAELAKWNAYPIVNGVLPSFGMMGKGTPPKSIHGLKGYTIRANPMPQKIYAAVGAVGTVVPGVEVYQAFDKGVLDAVTWPWTDTFFSYKVYELASWYTTSIGSLEPLTPCPVFANKDAYDALPQQYKDLIEAVKPEAYAAQFAAYKAGDEKALKVFKERGLVEVVWPEEEIDAIINSPLRDQVWGEWIEARRKEGMPVDELVKILEGAE